MVYRYRVKEKTLRCSPLSGNTVRKLINMFFKIPRGSSIIQLIKQTCVNGFTYAIWKLFDGWKKLIDKIRNNFKVCFTFENILITKNSHCNIILTISGHRLKWMVPLDFHWGLSITLKHMKSVSQIVYEMVEIAVAEWKFHFEMPTSSPHKDGLEQYPSGDSQGYCILEAD